MIAEIGARARRAPGADGDRRRRAWSRCPAWSTCTPTCASPAARTPRRSQTGTARRGARRVHRRPRDGEHQPGRRHRRRGRAGLAARPGGRATCDVQPGRRRHRRAWRASSSPSSARWPTRRPGCGSSPTTATACHDADAHAPRPGVRQGVRRRDRPARPGAPAHRGRPDATRARSRPGSVWPAGRPSPRRRSSPATCCWPSTSAPGCTSATSRPPARSRSSAGPRPAASTVTAEVTPHHLLLTDELAAQLRPGLQGQPAAAHAPPTSRRCAPASPTARSTSSPPTTPRTRPRTRSASGRRPRSGMIGPGDGAAAWCSEAHGEHRPARLGRRSPTGCPSGAGRGSAAAGRARPRPGCPSASPANLTLVDPAARWHGRRRPRMAIRSRNTPFAGLKLPGAGGRDVPARRRRRCSTERLAS